ncbi:MAG: amino acid permease [Candidatus Gastranaerophilales bacterium]|nr:amino acid permease [Candidatus Gastranaerophilales bacterium]
MSNEMKRTLSLPDSISIVAGSMIGCGIFLVSADITRQVHTAFLLLLVWILAGFISFCGAIAYGELAANIPDEGGQYMYLKKIYNDKVAFLFGWTMFLVIQGGTLAAISVAFAKFTGLLIPAISSGIMLFHLGPIHFSTQQLFALLTILLLTYINSKGIEYGIITQNLFTVAKLLSIAGIILCGVIFGMNWDVIQSNFALSTLTFHWGDIAKISTATVGALFASISWNNITFIAGEIKEPEKNVKKALAYGVGMVVLLYVLVNVIYVISTPVNAIQTAPEDIVAAVSMSAIFGKIGEKIIAVIIMISAFGCANGMVMAGARVYYKMAKDRLFFRNLAFINRKTKVPVNSLWAQCAWIAALIVWGNYTQLLEFVIFASLIFYVITMVGIFVYRKKYPDTDKSLRINNFYAISFIVLATYIIGCLAVYKPAYTLPGLLITLAGLPVYSLWNKAKEKAALERLSNNAVKPIVSNPIELEV